jgi:AcrR family transcriptional regulator
MTSPTDTAGPAPLPGPGPAAYPKETRMLATIGRALDTFRETIATMRATVAAKTPEGASAYRADYVHVTMPLPEYARLASTLADAVRIIESDAQREEKLTDRVTRLESSTGALMVDRDRGIRQAETRTAGARLVAADALAALREAGIEPGADLDTLAADAVRHYDDTLARLDRDNRRLEEFRCSIVGLIQQCQDQASAGRGLTPDQVGKLGRGINRANNKAMGR